MFAAAVDVAAALGLAESRAIQGQLDLAQALEDGLPVDAVDRVSRLVAPGDPAFRDRLVARSTLARRRRRRRAPRGGSGAISRARWQPTARAKPSASGWWRRTRATWSGSATCQFAGTGRAMS
jgi:hypothetical protein